MPTRWFAFFVLACLALPFPAVAQQPAAAQQIAYDYSALYEALNPSIVKIHADGGSGSGFLVSPNGLIATNHHVVRNSRHLTVQFADGRKIIASVVTLDPQFDLAILKIHSQVVAGITPLRLLPEARDVDVKAGIPVLAFGSPLSQTFLMTQGIVAKVENGVLLGDFLIQPGNSGGPLVTLNGFVVGVNTFAEQGISGAVRVTVLRRLLASEAVTAFAGPEPSPTLLPTMPAERYPTEVLKEKITSEKLDTKVYQLGANKFTVTALTPVLIGKSVVQEDLMRARNRFSRRGKKVNDPTWREVDTPFYEWTRSATSVLDNVVTFEIKPDFGSTTGSKWATALGALAAGLSKTAVAPVHQTMEFKAEFQDFKLYKDGQLVIPVHPGRSITEASLQGDYYTFIDEAYSGMYSYDPSVFASGTNYRVEVFDAREPGKPHAVISLTASHPLIQQLRRDFPAGEARPSAATPTGTIAAVNAEPLEGAWKVSLPNTTALFIRTPEGRYVLTLEGQYPLRAEVSGAGTQWAGTATNPCMASGALEMTLEGNGWTVRTEFGDCATTGAITRISFRLTR